MKDLTQLLNYLAVAETALVVMFVFILLSLKNNKKANLFFAFFIIIYSMPLSAVFLVNKLKLITYIFYYLTIPGISITGVLIYFYTAFMTGIIDRFKKKHLLHFLPFLLFMILNILSFRPAASITDMPLATVIVIRVMVGAGLINSFVYLVISYIRLKNYSRQIENYFSALEKVSMKWLIKVVIITTIFIGLLVASFLMVHFHWIVRPYNVIPGFLSILILVAMLFISIYHIINQPDIFRENKELYSMLNDSVNNGQEDYRKEKYAKHNLDIRTQKKYMDLLNEYMEKNKPYLNESITIKELADGIGVPYHHLSIVINNLLNKNFYNLINEYRINEVISILNDSGSRDANILSIAFKCGFNSKSTFNSAFKKITGKTPSEYRDNSASTSGLAS